MKRIAEPEEVAKAIAFLASNEADYINGINLPVDGGRTKSLQTTYFLSEIRYAIKNGKPISIQAANAQPFAVR